MSSSFLRLLIVFLVSLSPAFVASAQKAPIVDTLDLPEDEAVVKANEAFFNGEKAKMHNDTKKALENFLMFSELEPKSALGYYEVGKLYQDQKNPEKAEAALGKAVLLDRKNKWYLEEYGTFLAKEGRFAEAAKLIAVIVDSISDEPTYMVMASDMYDRAQKYPEAIKYIDKAITRSGNDEEVMMRKVQIYLHSEETEKAAVVIKQMIAADPKNGRNYKLLGELYENKKMPEKAMEVYKNAEKELPDDPTIQVGLAEHYLKQGDTAQYNIYAEKAILNKKLEVGTQIGLFELLLQSDKNGAVNPKHLTLGEELAKQHPDDAGVMAIYAELLENAGQPEKAVAYYKKSIAISSATYAVWERLLFLLSDKKDADTLIKYSEHTIRLFPNQAIAHYFNGLGHYNKNEYPAAIKAINRSIDMQPETNPQMLALMYSLLGDIYNTTKQYTESDKSFDKALQYEPNDATVLNNFAYYLSERNLRLDDAEKMSAKSLKIRPGVATFLDTYGWICYKRGEYAKAKEYIEKALVDNARADATIYDHLGNVYFQLKDKDKALQYWKMAKEKGGDSPLLDKKISEGKLYE